MKWWTTLSLNQRLALLAFALGAVALAAQPMRGSRASIDSRELALAVQRGADRIDVAELADWIMTGRADYRLIDLRPEKAYAEYHLPGAENIPLATLPDAELLRNEKLVLYAEDGVKASQGWFLLKAKGFKGVYMVKGGLDQWKSEVLYPVLGQADTAEAIIANAKRAAISTHFGGTPRTMGDQASAAATPEAAAAAPAAVATPVPPSAAPVRKTAAAPKKKEGC